MPYSKTPIWRDDIDALAFQPADHAGLCMVHRRAFRTLLRTVPSPQGCVDFYHTHPPPRPALPTDASVVVQAVLAMALGLFIVGVVGFSHISAVHNAAHDV